MKLQDMLRDLPMETQTRGDMSLDIGSLTLNSREKLNSGLFFCIPGARFDAHDFAAQAVENGCVALTVERWLDLPVPQVLVSNGRGAMARSPPRSCRPGLSPRLALDRLDALAAKILPAARTLAEACAASHPSPVYSRIVDVIAAQTARVAKP